MRLDTEFLRLPLRFDVDRLQQEVDAFDESDWCPHPQGFAGNSALLLISAGGNPADDGLKGPMRPTPLLERSPYLQQVLGAFGSVFGRTRLMRLEGNAEATRHMDASYYWHQRMRVHVPIRTTPEVSFLCGDRQVHMAAGESWLFDTWKKHNVINPTSSERIHLVADTVGSARFSQLMRQAWRPFVEETELPETIPIEWQPNHPVALLTEQVNFPVVMSPWEQQSLLQPILAELDAESNTDQVLIRLVQTFTDRWRALWHAHGTSEPGWVHYQQALEHFTPKLKARSGNATLANGMDAAGMIIQAVIEPALNPELAAASVLSRPQIRTPMPKAGRQRTPILRDPVFIVAAPRSGSTLLFETLAQSPDLYTIGGESHQIFESIPTLTPEANGFDSNRLTAAHATGQVPAQLRKLFLSQLKNRDGQSVSANLPPIRMLEKTPKNALRIPFLKAVFPKARFIYLVRKPRENISSIIDAWQSGKFVTYRQLPGRSSPWSLLLVPGWRDCPDDDIALTAAAQWRLAHQTMLADLSALDPEQVTSVRYEDLLDNPQGVIESLCDFARVGWDHQLDKALPMSRHTLTPPDPDKWKKNTEALERVLPSIRGVEQRVDDFLKR